MLGAIAGDIIGSHYEHCPTKSKDFALYREDSKITDDTVLTVAVSHWLMDQGSLVDVLCRYASCYPTAGYGRAFKKWANSSDRKPYGSLGNGSAMRVSPCGWIASSLEEAVQLATDSSVVTHDHPDGVAGAVAVAGSVHIGRTGGTKDMIREFVTNRCAYDLTVPLDEIRDRYGFDVSSRGSVPEAIMSFLESECYETAIRNAISLGGDADTQAAIAGSIAEAYYGSIPERIYKETVSRLDTRLLGIVSRFYETVIGRPLFIV